MKQTRGKVFLPHIETHMALSLFVPDNTWFPISLAMRVGAVFHPHKGAPNGNRVGVTYRGAVGPWDLNSSPIANVGHLWMRDASEIPSETEVAKGVYPSFQVQYPKFFPIEFHGLHLWLVRRVFGGDQNVLHQPEPDICLCAERATKPFDRLMTINATPDGHFLIWHEGNHARTWTGSLKDPPMSGYWKIEQEETPIDWDLVDQMMADLRYMLSV